MLKCFKKYIGKKERERVRIALVLQSVGALIRCITTIAHHPINTDRQFALYTLNTVSLLLYYSNAFTTDATAFRSTTTTTKRDAETEERRRSNEIYKVYLMV